MAYAKALFLYIRRALFFCTIFNGFLSVCQKCYAFLFRQNLSTYHRYGNPGINVFKCTNLHRFGRLEAVETVELNFE